MNVDTDSLRQRKVESNTGDSKSVLGKLLLKIIYNSC
jgi:hypothetical protein